MRLTSIDCETNGFDLHHGCKPYIVTACDEKTKDPVTYWEVDVDPLTRKPQWSRKDLQDIRKYMDSYDLWIFQNAKFDLTALSTLDRELFTWTKADWAKVHDTLYSSHLLFSNQPKDLTTLALIHIGVNIQPYEDKVKLATVEARKIAAKQFPDWLLADEGIPEMPSAEKKLWKLDMWVCRAIAKELKYPKSHHYWTVAANYANADSSVTLPIHNKLQERVLLRKLTKIYNERLKVLPVVYKMEMDGVTVSGANLKSMQQEFREDTATSTNICMNIAEEYGYELEMPKGSGNNGSLTNFVFGTLGLEVVKKTPTGKPCFDKDVIDHYMATLDVSGKPATFIRNLRGNRKRNKALEALDSYELYWMPTRLKDWYKLYCSLNVTGTDTLRFSSTNPNSQNISKQEGYNVRYCFGPAPGREWWSLDYSNLELVIPAYLAGETDMIYLFEKPKEPPYFGNYHMLIFDLLHPEKFAKHGMKCKEVYESTWYQWTKNGDFAVQYQAQEISGTADRAYHVPGAQRRIKERLNKINKLSEETVEFAKKYGYVETVPDKTVDPKRGYPLLCTRSKFGQILATVPLSYKIQGTAMWCTFKAMLRCQDYLDEINANKKPEYHAHMVLQVHDELVFDFPKSKVDPTSVKDWKTDKFNYLRTNLPHVKNLQKLMQQSGDDIGIPLRTTISYHNETWSKGVKV
jgi:DNA polymerase I-like protein with 3'-5' exonuclease and polymerase domains